MFIKIIRKIDSLGRIVIPQDIRRTLNLHHQDKIEIAVKNHTVLIKKGD